MIIVTIKNRKWLRIGAVSCATAAIVLNSVTSGAYLSIGVLPVILFHQWMLGREACGDSPKWSEDTAIKRSIKHLQETASQALSPGGNANDR